MKNKLNIAKLNFNKITVKNLKAGKVNPTIMNSILPSNIDSCNELGSCVKCSETAKCGSNKVGYVNACMGIAASATDKY